MDDDARKIRIQLSFDALHRYLPELTDEMKLDISAGDLYRLKKGIMRYFAAPGKLNLKLRRFVRKKKLRWALWPQMDRYDVEIRSLDGDIWKSMQRHIENLSRSGTKIQNDGGFPSGDYAAAAILRFPNGIYGQSAKLYRDHQLRTEGSKECKSA